jgi:hypothetical protein
MFLWLKTVERGKQANPNREEGKSTTNPARANNKKKSERKIDVTRNTAKQMAIEHLSRFTQERFFVSSLPTRLGSLGSEARRLRD